MQLHPISPSWFAASRVGFPFYLSGFISLSVPRFRRQPSVHPLFGDDAAIPDAFPHFCWTFLWQKSRAAFKRVKEEIPPTRGTIETCMHAERTSNIRSFVFLVYNVQI